MDRILEFIYQNSLFLFIFAIALPIFASIRVRVVYSKYKKVKVHSGLTGAQVAERILYTYRLMSSDVSNMKVEPFKGVMTDHYSPKEKIVRLSEEVYGESSIAAIGIAAHECGHAIQDAERFVPNRVRSVLFPVANIGSRFGPYLVFIGFLISSFGMIFAGDIFITVGIILFAFAVLFYMVTLPVEINASTRAVRVLRESGLLSDQEIGGAKKVLYAAAMTYVAAAASSVLLLLRLIAFRSRR